MAATSPGERVLAIDYGERRIGLALAEPGQLLVRGLPTIDRGKRRDDPIPAIERLAREHGVDRVVLGVPFTMAGTEGPAAADVRRFRARLEETLGVPVEEWDERLTTEAARRRLREIGYGEKEMRTRVDQLSAVLMLESWLARRGAAADPAPDPAADAPPAAPPPPAAPVLAEALPAATGSVFVEAPRPRRRWPRRLGLLALALVVAGGAGLWWASEPPSGGGAPVRVVVEPGTSVRHLARELEDRGVVRSALLLEAWLRARGDAGLIQAGTYELRRDLGLAAVADQLVEGRTVLTAVTVPEGLRLEEVALAVARSVSFDSAAFVAAAADPGLADTLLPDSLVGADPVTLEGYLFPETYRVDPAVDARSLARVMVAQFRQVFGPAWRARAESLGMSVHEIVTLASIVEEEARVPEERTTIAGVYWNRLRRGMPLEADPTVQYALGGHRERVLYRDLEVDSPYNTYRNPGLPPGPIASPGRAALEATLYPDSVPYLYFFAIGEGGRHTFSETYAEHLRKRRELGR
jgi:UPF0755 protein